MMPAVVLSALRTGAQVAGAAVVAWLIGIGVELPGETTGVLAVALLGLAVAVYTFAQRWLESRKGEALWQRGARLLGRVMLFGIGGRQPVYVAPTDTTNVRVIGSDGFPREP